MLHSLDLNCDLGELDEDEGLRTDVALLPLITSANVACGAHAGSVERMEQLAGLCREHNVAFGAHPGYADREGFGRRMMAISNSELRKLVRDQVRLAADVAARVNAVLTHVKPHGALYNLAARDPDAAVAVAGAVADIDPHLRLVGLSGSLLISAGRDAGLRTLREAFADRAYHADGSLVSRDHPDAVLHEPVAVARRAAEMVRSGQVMSIEGVPVSIQVDTVCVHGDTPEALSIVRQLRQTLNAAGIRLQHPL